MEKLANVQIQSSVAGKSTVRQSSASEPKDDFIRMLQQKTENPVQPETKKTKDDKESVKVPEEAREPVKEKPQETEEEPISDEELSQLELLQALLQQTAVQIAEPELTGQEMQAAETETKAVPVAVEAQPEAAVLQAEPVVQEQTKPIPEKAAPEAENPKAAAENPKQLQAEPEIARPQQSSGQAQADMDHMSREAAGKPVETPVTPVTSEPEETKLPAETVAASTGMVQQPVTQTERPLQAPRTEDVLQRGYQPKENIVQSTMEKLPQNLSRALGRQGLGEGNTLTVELEPASLGKLTIQLVYNAGRTAVSVMATNPRTLELLNEKATEIAAILKERTGEETVIYTQETERQPDGEAQQQSSSQGGQQERQQSREEKQDQHTESFMQQLRLGLV